MRIFILLAIRLYWQLVPVQWKRKCLFNETCSRHVYRITRQYGVSAGLSALYGRFRRCRPGYTIRPVDGALQFVSREGTVVSWQELSAHIMPLSLPVDDKTMSWRGTSAARRG